MSENAVLTALREQLVDLQTRLAFQEDSINALDTVVARQQRQIEQLERMWELQKQQLDNVLADLEKTVTEEKPPHY